MPFTLPPVVLAARWTWELVVVSRRSLSRRSPLDLPTLPHVVQIFDSGALSDGRPFIVMELLRGESLAARLERRGRAAMLEAALLVEQIAKALEAAHKLDIVHRDVKPHNVFVLEGDDLFVKLVDFGIAKDLRGQSGLTGGASLGTWSYMSPEQISSARGADRHADIWSLAVVAYELLTGVRPFRGETDGAVVLAIDSRQYDPPSSLDLGLPAVFDPFFARAFHRAASARYPSARELARAFAVMTRHEPRSREARRWPPPQRSQCNRSVKKEAVEVTQPLSPACQAKLALLSADQRRDTTPVVADRRPEARDGGRDAGVPWLGNAQDVLLRQARAAITAWRRVVGRARTLASPFASSVRHGVRKNARTAAGFAVAVAVVAFVVIPTPPRPGPSASLAARAHLSATPDSADAPTTLAPPPSAAATPVSLPLPAEMVLVAAGSYPIGCSRGVDERCYLDEGPVHIAAVERFGIMRYEVTALQYDECVRAGRCPAAGTTGTCTWTRGSKSELPVTCVTLKAAQSYCSFRGWRLPKESEWELAARGQRGSRFPWGSVGPDCAVTVGHDGRRPGCGSGRPASVGSRLRDRSWCGAYDLGGNVREWTDDAYSAYPGGSTVANRSGTVTRGGSFMIPFGDFSLAYTRDLDAGTDAPADVGFRCAVSL
jgi:formylglycine-generating enzyme required for sulfatase activity